MLESWPARNIALYDGQLKWCSKNGPGTPYRLNLCVNPRLVMQAVVALREQYRMAADIMLLANTIVYDGQLRCGAEAVADATLDLQIAPSQMQQPQWLAQVER